MAGVRGWRISPEWTPTSQGPEGVEFRPGLVMSDDALKEALRTGQAGLYAIQGRKVGDRTLAALERMQAGRFRPPATVNAGDPNHAEWLLGGWHKLETGFRWMAKRAGVLLNAPEGTGRQVVLRGFCPPWPARPEVIEVRAALNGEPAASPGVLRHCSGNFALAFPVPAAPSGFERLHVDLELSRTFRVPGDDREFGLVFGTIGVE
jgi:hypothetical protein